MSGKWLLLIGWLLLFAAGCRKNEAVSLPGLQGIKTEYAMEKNGCLILQHNGRAAVLKPSGNTCEVQGVPVVMPDVVVRESAAAWRLPERSVEMIIKLLLLEQEQHISALRIVIDPGHGGKDAGTKATVSGRLEKELNLSMALLLGEELKRHGFKIFYTRTDDRFVELGKRGKMYPDADLFISIHHNWAARQGASGFETFCFLPDGKVSSRCTRSVKLAYAIQQNQSRASGNYGRGVKFADFRVLRDAGCPAVLLEIGFLSNPDEEKRCVGTDFQKVMAKAVAAGILQTVSVSIY